MSTINENLVRTLHAGNKAFKSAYGRISGNVRAIEEAGVADLDSIAEHIKLSLTGIEKEDVPALDKAYMTASKRILGNSFGIAWDNEEDCAVFRLPTKEVSRKKDPFKQKVGQFLASGPSDDEKQYVMDLMDKIMASEGEQEAA